MCVHSLRNPVQRKVLLSRRSSSESKGWSLPGVTAAFPCSSRLNLHSSSPETKGYFQMGLAGFLLSILSCTSSCIRLSQNLLGGCCLGGALALRGFPLYSSLSLRSSQSYRALGLPHLPHPLEVWSLSRPAPPCLSLINPPFLKTKTCPILRRALAPSQTTIF